MTNLSSVAIPQPVTPDEPTKDSSGWAEALLLAVLDAREMLLDASRSRPRPVQASQS